MYPENRAVRVSERSGSPSSCLKQDQNRWNVLFFSSSVYRMHLFPSSFPCFYFSPFFVGTTSASWSFSLVWPSSLSRLCCTGMVLHLKVWTVLADLFTNPFLFSFLPPAVSYHRSTLSLCLRTKGLLLATPDVQSAHLFLLSQTSETRFIIDCSRSAIIKHIR